MRKIFRIPNTMALAFTALFLLPGMLALAQPGMELRLHHSSSSVAVLDIDSLSAEEPVSVRLLNERGQTLFSDQSKDIRYVKFMDFGKVKNGRYIMEIIHPTVVIRKRISKSDNSLSIEEDGDYLYNRIEKLQEDGKKLLVKLSSNLDEKLSVRITDSEGHVLHEKKDIEPAEYAALFNLTALRKGEYSLSLSCGDFSKSTSFLLD